MLRVAWMTLFMLLGSSIWILDQSHPPECPTSLTLICNDSRVKGPWMVCLKGPRVDQLSCQKSRLLSDPGIHLIPFLNISFPLFKPFQTLELGNLFSFLKLTCWWLQYFNLKTLAHEAFFSLWNLQFNLASKIVFLPLVVWIPRPLYSFGLATFLQSTQCIFLLFSNEPQRKFLFTLSIPSRTLPGSILHCMT